MVKDPSIFITGAGGGMGLVEEFWFYYDKIYLIYKKALEYSFDRP